MKDSKRGGAIDLGKHLLKAENEHIDVPQAQVASVVREKLTGFMDSITAEFAEAAQTLEEQRLAMGRTSSRRTTRPPIQTRKAPGRRIEVHAARFRKGLRGSMGPRHRPTWEVCRQNELETAACTQRDVDEKQPLIDRQPLERRGLQREIRHARHSHFGELTGLYREATGNHFQN
ncbi:hypothetical protein NKJ46_25355 [Mesorhizobium sp. M0166]|uniref:hypothetical protein n=1 Tax=Mesorhizobium sp. M0166 TaxID=2956902 RepID=UPI003338B065